MRALGLVWVMVSLAGCLSTGTGTSSTGNTSGSPGTGSGSSGGPRGGPGTTGTGTTGGAGTTGTTGGPQCVTAADCDETGDICLDGGNCGAPPNPPDLSCVAIGSACAAGGSPCCQGACGDAGFCTAWSRCAVLGEACNGNDCCWNESCDAGICTPACGDLSTGCTQDADCCAALGLVCRPPKIPTGNPMECVSLSSSSGSSCVPHATAGELQCNLGTACSIGASDPCAPAGYVCDSFYRVCREPFQYERCIPGGPACQGIADSTVAATRCIEFAAAGYAECVQPCQETSDCLSVSGSCEALPETSGSACFGNYGCADYFGACDAEATGDGTCVPVQTSDGIQGLCEQDVPDAGSTCNHAANRENGGLCARGQRCIAGLCSDLCNAGTFPGGPGCASGACVALGATTDPSDEGICEPACNFLVADAGGCASSPAIPEKCVPEYIDGFPDNGAGLCALAVADPPGLGQTCSQQDPLHADSCGSGQACAVQQGGSETICVQLCTEPGTQSDCPPGQSCQYWYSGGVASTIMGSCG